MTVSRTARRPIGVLFLFSLVALLAACGGEIDQDGLRSVSASDAAELIEIDPEGLIVLDVRTPEEFAEGHLDDATLINYYAAEFTAEINELDRDAPYVLYCRSGNRSRSAMNIMENLGFTNVAEIKGGIGSWMDDGQAVVQ